MPAGAERALALTRLVYGTTLLARPDALIKFSSAHPADPHARLVARVLGARHCAQAVLVGSTRKVVAHELAAVVDLLHAMSMAGLAVFDHKYRRAEIIDGSIAASLAAAQLAALRRAG
jgi:hypothetical protein